MSEALPRERPAKSAIIGNVAVAMIGAVALVIGVGYGVFRDGNLVGPGFVPVVASALVLLFSLVEIGKLYFRKPVTDGKGGGSLMDRVAAVEKEASNASSPSGDDDLDTFGRTKKQQTTAIMKVFGTIFLAIVLTPWLGLLLSVGLMVVVLTILVEHRRVLPSVLTAVAAVAFAYLVFVQVLHVPVPTGPLGFI